MFVIEDYREVVVQEAVLFLVLVELVEMVELAVQVVRQEMLVKTD
jgi:hypothetical protein